MVLIECNSGNGNLIGGDGDDILTGGNDVLSGGAGSDTVSGGAGSDCFIVLRHTGESDTTTDFQADVGKIEQDGTGMNVPAVIASTQVARDSAVLNIGMNHPVTIAGTASVNPSWFG